MTYELEQRVFASVAGMFRDREFDRPMANSVLEGTQPGRVFADDVAGPSLAVVIHPCGLCFPAADAPPEADDDDRRRRFLAAVVSRAGRPLRWSATQPWRPALEAIYDGRLRETRRLAFHFFGTADGCLAGETPPGIAIQAMDEELARATDVAVNIELGSWRTPGEFVSRGGGYALLDGGRIVGAATTYAVGAGEAEIDIGLSASHRRRGLGTALARALIAHHLRLGQTPAWACDAVNEASAALARKVGFRERGSYAWLVVD